MNSARVFGSVLALLLLVACGTGGDQEAKPGREGRGDRPRGGMMGGGEAPAAVPVQVQSVTRRSISQSLHANGTLEAENEVELVARTVGPVTELLVEEGDIVHTNELMARIDDREARNRVAIASVSHEEARLTFTRAETTRDGGLISQEAYDSATAQLEAAAAQLESERLELAYTEIRAPFDAQVVVRRIRLAEHVTNGAALFRISDFTPLLCPIRVPEKDLPRLVSGQAARIRVESYPNETFSARVLRIRPTVDAATGTVTVTLEVEGRGMLRPGMFASVFVETDTHHDALVIPRKALVLDAIGDTVFVRDGDTAIRRDLSLGFREDDAVEVLEGLTEGDELIVLGQDGLADGTPVAVLDEIERAPADRPDPGAGGSGATGPPPGGAEKGGRPGGSRGPDMSGGIPPRMEQRIRDANPEDLENIKERMRSFGMEDEQIEQIIKRIRDGASK